MGKGGTRFVAEAVGERGRGSDFSSSKERRKAMEKFLESGVHPEIARAQMAARDGGGDLHALPELDANRPFVFLEFSFDGRVVIELFEDLLPMAASAFRNRCLPGGTVSLVGTPVHKLVPYFALYGGKRPAGSEPVKYGRTHLLQHVEAGTVSMAIDGSDFAIAMCKALSLEATHQVVGRVHMGKEVLDKCNDIVTMPDDSPVGKLVISDSGMTNSRGEYETLEGALPKETRAQAAARLQQESADTRSAVLEALQVGMKRKAGPDGAGPSGGAAGEPAADGAGTSKQAAGPAAPAPAAPAAGRSVKSRMMDSLLDDLSGEDDSSSGGSGS